MAIQRSTLFSFDALSLTKANLLNQPFCFRECSRLFGFFELQRLAVSSFFARVVLPPPFTYGLEPLPSRNNLVYPLGVVTSRCPL